MAVRIEPGTIHENRDVYGTICYDKGITKKTILQRFKASLRHCWEYIKLGR